MSTARFILIALVLASPAILLWDGLIAQGFITLVVSIALVATSFTLSASEVKFLSLCIRAAAVGAAIPALWILFQMIPVQALAHPIWMSAAAALKQPLTGKISIDIGATILSFSQYIALCAAGLLAAAVAMDRNRAQSLLFVLGVSGAVASLLMISRKLVVSDFQLSTFQHAQALDCIGMSAIFAAAAALHTFEHDGTPRSPRRASEVVRRWTLIACMAAFAVCLIALFLYQSRDVIVAVGCGLAVLLSVAIIRRMGLSMWLAAAMGVPIVCIAFLIIANHSIASGISRLLAFSDTPIGESERILDDAPLVGTGAGTYATIAPIYRVTGDKNESYTAPTVAAALAIELGRPMFALIAILLGASIVIFLKASFMRRRDWIYSAAEGSCLVALCLIALINGGLIGNAAGLMIAVGFGLAFAQTKSRTALSA